MNFYKLDGYLKTAVGGTNTQYYPAKEGGFFNYHYERGSLEHSDRQIVFMTYLNDIEEGGETEFYWQNIKMKPIKQHKYNNLTEANIVTNIMEFGIM